MTVMALVIAPMPRSPLSAQANEATSTEFTAAMPAMRSHRAAAKCARACHRNEQQDQGAEREPLPPPAAGAPNCSPRRA